jgi:hypothetical protein
MEKPKPIHIKYEKQCLDNAAKVLLLPHLSGEMGEWLKPAVC